MAILNVKEILSAYRTVVIKLNSIGPVLIVVMRLVGSNNVMVEPKDKWSNAAARKIHAKLVKATVIKIVNAKKILFVDGTIVIRRNSFGPVLIVVKR